MFFWGAKSGYFIAVRIYDGSLLAGIVMAILMGLFGAFLFKYMVENMP